MSAFKNRLHKDSGQKAALTHEPERYAPDKNGRKRLHNEGLKMDGLRKSDSRRSAAPLEICLSNRSWR